MASERPEHRVDDLEVGDVVTISARETPMEVISVSETPFGNGVNVELKNRYGIYLLRKKENQPLLLYAGAQWYLESNVEVTDVR